MRDTRIAVDSEELEMVNKVGEIMFGKGSNVPNGMVIRVLCQEKLNN